MIIRAETLGGYTFLSHRIQGSWSGSPACADLYNSKEARTDGIDGPPGCHNTVLLACDEGIPQPATEIGGDEHHQVGSSAQATQVRQLCVQDLNRPIVRTSIMISSNNSR